MDQNDETRFPDEVVRKLQAGGWFPSRRVTIEALPHDYPIFRAARVALEEFYGFKIGSGGKGIECATSDVEFLPDFGDGMRSHTGSSNASGSKIFSLEEMPHGHACLFIDEDGLV